MNSQIINSSSETSGNNYILWPFSILSDPNLHQAIVNGSTTQFLKKENLEINPSATENIAEHYNFRQKFPATLRTKDGHLVRSRGELIIDNALYEFKLAHAYERKLPIEEELFSDFFLPSENVYIEYWGLESDQKYSERKNKKIEIYRKYDFKLIELTDEDIANLDDFLPKKLLKYGIKVY